MALVHMLIGLGEGLATGLIILAVLRARPQLVAGVSAKGAGSKGGFIGYGIVLSVGLALFVAPFACSWPDGLDSFTKALGIPEQTARLVPAPFRDYKFPLVGSGPAATALAGLVGVVVVFIAAYLFARFLAPSLGTPKKDAPSH